MTGLSDPRVVLHERCVLCGRQQTATALCQWCRVDGTVTSAQPDSSSVGRYNTICRRKRTAAAFAKPQFGRQDFAHQTQSALDTKRRLAAAQPQHSTAQHSTAQRRRSEYSADLLLRYRLAHMLALFKPQRLQGLALECVAHQPERISTTYNTTDDTADNIAYNRRHSRQRLALQCDR